MPEDSFAVQRRFAEERGREQGYTRVRLQEFRVGDGLCAA